MNYFSSNLGWLHKKNPRFAEMIATHVPDPRYQMIDLGDGLFDISYEGKKTYTRNPRDVAKENIQLIKFTYPKLLIMYGVGLGYHIDEFFKIPNRVSEHILIVEKSLTQFYWALHAFDWTPILRDFRVTLMVGVAPDEIQEELTEYFGKSGAIVMVQALETLINISARPDEQEYYVHFSKTLKETVDIMNLSMNCPPEDAYHGFMNIIQNLSQGSQVPDFGILEKKFHGKPGIVVSTGPSLKYSIEWLKKIGDRAVIACADSALRILLSHGIKPHFTGCLERSPETKYFFENLQPTPDVYMLTNPIVWPETYQAYQGPKLHLMRPIGQLKWFFPESKLYFTGRSVAHLQYAALREMGCSPILLVGQDLAFDPHSGQSHSEGAHSFFLEVGAKDRNKIIQEEKMEGKRNLVEGNNDNQILTTHWYSEFKNTFELLIRQDGTNCYNVIPKEYGAKIRRTTRIDPNDALSLIPEESFPVREIIKHSIEQAPLPSIQEYQKHKIERLEEALVQLEKFKLISLEVMDACSEFFFRHNPHHYGEQKELYIPFLKKLELIANSLFKLENEFYFYFLHALTMDKIVILSQQFQGLLSGKIQSNTERLDQQFSAVMTWFSTAILWSSRMERYIQREIPKLFPVQLIQEEQSMVH